MEDEDKLTPCDHAERHHHTELALSLESQMVFSSSSAQQSHTDAHGETNLLQYKEVRPWLPNVGFPCWPKLFLSFLVTVESLKHLLDKEYPYCAQACSFRSYDYIFA